MQYLIVGNEITPTTGKLHYQNFVQFRKKIRFPQVKKVFGNDCHVRAMYQKSTPQANMVYCKKDENFTEFGTIIHERARTDLYDARKAADFMSLEELMESDHAQVVARSMPYFRLLYANRKRRAALNSLAEQYANAELKEWQQDLVTKLEQQPHPRKIHWYEDVNGGQGKSFMANYLVTKFNALIITHGKLADLTYAYDSEPIVVVDLARTQADKIDHLYQFMEDLKNGRVFSTKYESGNKYFKPPHVVVFANFVPGAHYDAHGKFITNDEARGKIWSLDRWDVKTLE